MRSQIPTVHEMRKRGWKVRVGHFRNFYRYCPRTGKKHQVTLLWKEQRETYPNYFLNPNGGHTIVSITIPEKNLDIVGYSYCSEDELYAKGIGTMKATARALGKI
jgi:hypothetical protein